MSFAEASIIVLEDDELNLLAIKNILRGKYNNVKFFTNGLDAYAYILENIPDILLLDVVVPGLDGFSLYENLSKNGFSSDIPVIFLTSRTDVESVKTAFGLGAKDFVTKPFKSVELLARVESQLKIKYQQEELKTLNVELEQLVSSRTLKLSKALDELQATKEHLKALETAKNEFLHLISHELRTPLNSIMGFASVLGRLIIDERQQLYVKNIINSGRTLLRFSEVALLLTSLRAEVYDLVVEDLDLVGFISIEIEMLQKQYEEENLKINFKCEHKQVVIRSDISLVRFCLQEVLKNAIKNIASEPKVEVFVFELADKVILEIKDKGVGFSSYMLNNPFEVFHIENINHHSQGHGLGLPAVKLIMDYLSGKIEIGNNIDEGAWVSLSFNKAFGRI